LMSMTSGPTEPFRTLNSWVSPSKSSFAVELLITLTSQFRRPASIADRLYWMATISRLRALAIRFAKACQEIPRLRFCAAPWLANRSPSRALVAQPGEALLAPEHGEDVEDAGRGRAAGKRGAQRLRHLAELQARLLGMGAHRAFRRCSAPFAEPIERGQERGNRRARVR